MEEEVKTYLVQVKVGCRYRTIAGVVTAGHTAYVTQEELDAFGDKFEEPGAQQNPEPVRHGPPWHAPEYAQSPAQEPAPAPLKATGPATEYARANGVNLDMVQPSGANGKITLSDVKRHIADEPGEVDG